VGSSREVPQHLRVGVELDFEIEVTIRERNEQETVGVEDRLRHRWLRAHTRRRAADIIAGVRLEPVSVFRWSYEEDARVAAPGYAIVSAYGGDEGIGYGEGRGTATGRVEGSVVWSNYPRRRSDGRMLPNTRGLITTPDGAAIMFELRGRTVFGDDGLGRQNLVGWFESDHESYRWLNDVVCIAEGTIGAEGMEIHVYAGIHDLPGG
jgi:Protein of unknown function (DUF3237)